MRPIPYLLVIMMTLLIWTPVEPVFSDTTVDLRIPQASPVLLYGQETEDFFGTDLAVGDLNGDGIADLAVGAYLADGPRNVRNGAGEVYIFYGRPANEWPATGRQPDITVYGAAIGNSLGGDWSKQPGHIAIGDLDDDGWAELVLSSPTAGWGQSRRIGRVYILWGQPNLPATIDLATPPASLSVTTLAPSARDFLGTALAIGDFDGDQVADLAMTAPLAETETRRNSSGMVYVLFGRRGPGLRHPMLYLDRLPKELALFRVVGPEAGTRLGSSVTFGRLSNDDVPDLAIGTTGAGPRAQGTVEVVFGGPHVRNLTWDLLTRPADWQVIGENSGDTLGRFLATGDINADRWADLVMAAPAADGPAGFGTGQAIGIFGPLKLYTRRQLAIDPGDLTIYGPQGGKDQAWLGESVTVGDFNGDGTGDLLVGARQANGFNRRNESGIAYLFLGQVGLSGVRDLRRTQADRTFVGAQARDFTGYVAAGDLTGDGIADLVISATDRTAPGAGLRAGAVYIFFGQSKLRSDHPG